MEVAALDRLAKRLARCKEMTLAHELLEGSRTHSIGKRPPQVREPRVAHNVSRDSPRMRSAYTAQWLSPAPSRANAIATPVASA